MAKVSSALCVVIAMGFGAIGNTFGCYPSAENTWFASDSSNCRIDCLEDCPHLILRDQSEPYRLVARGSNTLCVFIVVGLGAIGYIVGCGVDEENTWFPSDSCS